MPKCETCPSTFRTQSACEQHMTEKRHKKPTKKCDRCNRLFHDRSAAEQHMTDAGHWNPKISCETCPNKFQTQTAAEQHMTDKKHHKNYCKTCEQKFSNGNDLKMHLISNKTHCGHPHHNFCKTVEGNANAHIETTTCMDGFQRNETAIPGLNPKDAIRNPIASRVSNFASDYTVGWICALPIEMAAAEGMLDETYPPPQQHRLDENIYVVGKIAHLKIVIVCLPSGVPGTTSATRAAEHMRLTFTQLKFSLLVGIAGGIPSKKFDVRLGDIVVGIPSTTSPAVTQYDYGKSIQGGLFRQTGYLNQPPSILLNAITLLRSRELLRSPGASSPISAYLAGLQAKYPGSESGWSYPGAENDKLFKSSYNHEGNNLTCAECNLVCLEIRPTRKCDQPMVHYGPIASANQVMRDAVARERLCENIGALCVEMEAAGLMNNFSCLVIRGISDYADSHKNKSWQMYAAATAAAFAKELLSVIPKHDSDRI